ncbi:Protein FPV127 [Dissostichus eleginoides]|uniref:Protein FPV127 n=1 Tax=Dissostichus eleginoides TaxID=100907 RepID=A0AAD9BDM3_DISEL|nr:Protein FPV127 [Dissostichus eleginoides]
MNQDQVILRSVSQTPCIGTNTGVTLMPQQEQQQDFEHGFQPGNESQKAFSEFRIKQLHNRRFMLLEMQRFRKKDDGVSTTGELPCEDSDQLCELENIQRELEELEKQRNASEPSANGGTTYVSF